MKNLLWKSSLVCLLTIFVMFFNFAYADDNASSDDNAAANNNTPQLSCTLSDEKSSDGKIGDAKDAFNKDTAMLYLSCAADKITKGEKIKAVWIADDTNNVAPPNYQIVEKEIVITPDTDTSQGGTADFSLSKPTKGWPVGSYHIALYIDGGLDQSVKFSVKK